MFVIGLNKAGSTLLNNMMAPLCHHAGLRHVSFSNQLRALGVSRERVPPSALSKVFESTGYAYIGFRGLDASVPLPDFASGRTVFLVRDPRDMLVSVYFSRGFSHRPPGKAFDETLLRDFEARRQNVIDTPIDEYALSHAQEFIDLYQKTWEQLSKINHRIWRYEDVIFEKKQWAVEMLDYLELDMPVEVINRVVERNDVVPDIENKHDHIRRVTPGDHVDKSNLKNSSHLTTKAQMLPNSM